MTTLAFELPAQPPDLRPYQLAAIEQLDAAVETGALAPLLVMPTGAGKTRIAAELIRRELERGGSAIFLAPRRELIDQASDNLLELGIEHGVLLAGAARRANLYARAQVASIDTVLSRVIRRQRVTLLDYSMVIVDEAHLSITAHRQRLMNLWPNALRIGLTATPTRKDGRALGVLYDALIEPCTPTTLTEQGYLVPARYYSLSEPDLARVRTVAGDYQQGELDAAVNRAELVGDILEHWLRLAPRRRTVVFCCSIAHSVAMAEVFLRAGVAAEHVSADTPKAERKATFARFARGETQVLCNVFLAAYGFDLPTLDCVVLARPTRSLMLYLQMLGRGLRIADGKSDCLVLDHSGCVHRFGFAHDERVWTLAGTRALCARPASRGERGAHKMLDCPECSCTFGGSRTCPECGYTCTSRGRDVQALDGELIEVGEHSDSGSRDRLAFYLELRGCAALHGYKPGWSAHKFRVRYGTFPPWSWNDLPPADPSIATQRWLRSQQIRWAKAQEAHPPGAC